ncbi:MAG: hypothetical protein LBP19_10385 [Treponema sp.]|nr:hypothetical protein [Treponema sp.]
MAKFTTILAKFMILTVKFRTILAKFMILTVKFTEATLTYCAPVLLELSLSEELDRNEVS